MSFNGDNMLNDTMKQLTDGSKGILAADESVPTISKRFAACGIESTVESRFEYRKMLFSSENLGSHIAGIILHEETLVQMSAYITELGILPGIKVDQGLMDYNGYKITKGIDTLNERLLGFKNYKPKFCKWRAVYDVTCSRPEIWEINSINLAIYAKICQQHNLVPIVEPEILLDGDYSIEEAKVAHSAILKITFDQLKKHGVDLNQIVLKPSMVLPGKNNPQQIDSQAVAKTTVDIFMDAVDHNVKSINFLSGGQTPKQAADRLKAIKDYSKSINSPFRFSFSYARALQEPAIKLFSENKISEAQQSLIELATTNTA